MSTAKTRYTILVNAIANGGGIEKVDLHSELAKTESLLNLHKANEDMNNFNALKSNNSSTFPGNPNQPIPVESQNSIGETTEMPINGTNSSQTGESMPEQSLA